MAGKAVTKSQADKAPTKRKSSGKTAPRKRNPSRKVEVTSDIAQAQEAFQREQGEHG